MLGDTTPTDDGNNLSMSWKVKRVFTSFPGKLSDPIDVNAKYLFKMPSTIVDACNRKYTESTFTNHHLQFHLRWGILAEQQLIINFSGQNPLAIDPKFHKEWLSNLVVVEIVIIASQRFELPGSSCKQRLRERRLPRAGHAVCRGRWRWLLSGSRWWWRRSRMPSKLLPTKEQSTRIGSEVLLETFLNIWINEPSNHLEDLSPCQEDNAIHVNWSLCRTASDDPSTLPQFKFKLKSESLSETAISVSL